ncbi:hypothetical protein [Acaryochloris sp. IP29b_bin.137]|uniref:hypothetical protein n=1 Tax=Acaryochloris sp. IP29b_bin.137 TaxID=2969217 RepID=UPI0026185A8D|nr:hypothetical protein [Acaryochloris sp. IP29b_bin.137]
MLLVAVKVVFIPTLSVAQTTNTIDASNSAESNVSPDLELQQSGILTNSQRGPRPLGKSIVGKGLSDCTTSGLALSVFGNGVGPFDTGSIGGSFTYTQSAGMEACKRHARSQLTRIKLETCLLLISNYSKMKKAGIKVSYEALKKASGVECPNLTLEQIVPGAAINN